MNLSLGNKVAVVTGGGSGIGFAIAKKLIEEGAYVVITGRRQHILDEAVERLGKAATGIVADVSQSSSLDLMFAEVTRKFGHIDILIANAGAGVFAPLGQITESQIDSQLSTNIKGVVLTIQGALPQLVPGSSVVIIGSTASVDPGPSMSIYGATKSAVRNMVRSWMTELRGSGIRINILSPGPVNTDALHGAFGEQVQESLAQLRDKSPIGRIGEPEEIAAVAAFLVSEAASYVNGIELFADGGASQT